MHDRPRHETQRVCAIYEKNAPRYDRQMDFFDRLLFDGARAWACSQARGETLEIALGTGRNLPHYPPGCRLTGIELSPAMLGIARRRADGAGLDVELRVGDAQALDYPDATFDSVVVTLALCTIPDDRQAVREIGRVLKPGGRLLLVEHVRSPVTWVRWGQRLLEPVALRFEGDHLLREPLEHLRSEGFDIEEVIRTKLGIVERVRARMRDGVVNGPGFGQAVV